ncbi:hypothetical protein BU15DRAFT_64569 [Melanogaster broomeanus]|nr:hypothetical protein BU15DRAFT_64569 [Melanogaster broomeanus]
MYVAASLTRRIRREIHVETSPEVVPGGLVHTSTKSIATWPARCCGCWTLVITVTKRALETMPRAETRYLTLSSLQPPSTDHPRPSDMPSLIPNIFASLQKALACLRVVLTRQAAPNFCTSPISRPEVAGGKYQRTNASHGTIPKLSANIRDVSVQDLSSDSQLSTSIHTSLDPSSEEVTSQEASSPAIESSHQNSLQSSKSDTPSLRYPPSTAENSRATSPGPPQSSVSENASSRVQQPVSQPECGGHGQPPSHPPSEPQNQVGRPLPSDLLALAKPIVPGQLQRYHRKVKTNQTYYTEEIPPYKLGYIVPEVSEWFRYTHPEGAPYFVSHSRGGGNVKRIYTDTDLSVPQHLRYVEDFIPVLVDAVAHIQDPRYADLTLVLELSYEETHRRRFCTYYFAQNLEGMIFWVHPVKIRDVCGNIKGVRNDGHLFQHVLSERITGLLSLLKVDPIFFGRHHIELYPTDIQLQEYTYLNLQEILIHANADHLDRQHSHPEYSVTVIARVHRLLSQYRFLNSYGQFDARLGGGRSVFSRKIANEEPVSWLLKCVDVGLLGAPIAHLRSIRKIWVDELIDESRWKTYITSLNAEWNGFTIFVSPVDLRQSTVVLAVDISFLAVPGVQAASGDSQSAATISIYASVISSVCALIISVILAGQIRGHDVDSVGGGADYMARMTRNAHGDEALAVIFSLPYSLLLWAMLSFIVALGFVIFQTKDTLTLGTMIPIWGVVILLAFLPLWWRRLPSLQVAVVAVSSYPWRRAAKQRMLVLRVHAA